MTITLCHLREISFVTLASPMCMKELCNPDSHRARHTQWSIRSNQPLYLSHLFPVFALGGKFIFHALVAHSNMLWTTAFQLYTQCVVRGSVLIQVRKPKSRSVSVSNVTRDYSLCSQPCSARPQSSLHCESVGCRS